MPQHSASPSSVFIVRAIPRDEQVDYYASRVDEGFAAFHPALGPLHTSRFRNLIAQFVSPAEAETFLRSQRERTLERFQDIRIEPAPSELAASFLTMEAERRAALQQLLPLVDRVLEVFDFNRVHRAMIALDWKYINDPQSPDIEVARSSSASAVKMPLIGVPGRPALRSVRVVAGNGSRKADRCRPAKVIDAVRGGEWAGR